MKMSMTDLSSALYKQKFLNRIAEKNHKNFLNAVIRRKTVLQVIAYSRKPKATGKQSGFCPSPAALKIQSFGLLL